ncbi:MAG: sigma-54 interaction domain-containing protein [Planctomycetota bacterium]|jgi:transcriptional regulator with PAS, ATPase and Fis domain
MTYDPSISETYRAIGFTFTHILTVDPAMKTCLAKARQAAASDVTVLLLGENGTGKNLIAQAIHNASPRSPGSFVSVNCSAFPETLLESELFGHERGAFTGAERTRKGRFELADGGTLFLDEIAEMSNAAQAKILRTVEYREFERVGGEETLQTNVRIVASTNRDILNLVKKGTFRTDLYYRLNEVTIEIPPLRDRKGDIPLLVEHFIRECNRKYRKSVKEVSPSAGDHLLEHDWPGNVRELRAAIKRGVACTQGEEITLEDLAFRVQLFPTDLGSSAEEEWSLETMERRHIQRVLEVTQGNKKEACRLLGITRPTLDRKIKRYHLPVPKPKKE